MNIIVGGTAYDSETGNDIAVAAFDPAGQSLWTGQLELSGNQTAKDMAIDPATGEIVITGYSGNPGPNENDSDGLGAD